MKLLDYNSFINQDRQKKKGTIYLVTLNGKIKTPPIGTFSYYTIFIIK